jgi:hypothetical protein
VTQRPSAPINIVGAIDYSPLKDPFSLPQHIPTGPPPATTPQLASFFANSNRSTASGVQAPVTSSASAFIAASGTTNLNAVVAATPAGAHVTTDAGNRTSVNAQLPTGPIAAIR